VETALAFILGDLTQGVQLLRIHRSVSWRGAWIAACDCAGSSSWRCKLCRRRRGLVSTNTRKGAASVDGEAAGLRTAGHGPRTVDANHALGFEAITGLQLAGRDLHELGMPPRPAALHNPRKFFALFSAGIEGRCARSLRSAAQPALHSLPADQEGKDGASADIEKLE